MQKRFTSGRAESGYDCVDCFADRDAARTQQLIVPGCLNRDGLVEYWRDRIAPQIPRDPLGVRFIARPAAPPAGSGRRPGSGHHGPGQSRDA